MNNFIFKRLFNVLVSTIFILPIDASFGDQDHFPPVPGSPQPAVGGHAAPAPAPLTDAQKESISWMLGRVIDEIQKIHILFGNTEGFSEGHPDDKKTKIIVHDIKRCFDALLPVFLQKFQRKGVHYTPENTAANGTHLEDIKGNPSALFTSKGPADFLKSVGADNFFLVSTHFGNTYFIPKWMTQPNKGFGLYQLATRTLDKGVGYSEYNVRRMLAGQNPLSHSGVSEIHHAYQNQEAVCYLCHSEHKGKFKEYHKSERETLINRAIAGSEAYYINKLTALLTLAKAAAHILEDEDSVSDQTSTFIMFIKEYRGNLEIIPNGTEVEFKKSTKLREGFEHMARKAPAHDLTSDSDHSDDDTEVLAFPGFDLPSKRDSLSSERTSLASAFGDSDSDHSDDDTEVLAFPGFDLPSKRDSLSSERTSLASAFGDFDDSNSRDSVASSSSSLVQQTRRVSISSAVTDNLSSDEVSQKSTQPEKRDRSVTGKENSGQSPVRKKKPGGNRVPLSPLN